MVLFRNAKFRIVKWQMNLSCRVSCHLAQWDRQDPIAMDVDSGDDMTLLSRGFHRLKLTARAEGINSQMFIAKVKLNEREACQVYLSKTCSA